MANPSQPISNAFTFTAPGRNVRRVPVSETQMLLAIASDAELFHDEQHRAFATVPVLGHRETHRIAGRAFKRWLRGEFFRRHRGGVPKSKAVDEAIATIDAQAIFAAPMLTVHLRVAEHGNAYYLDLGDETWQAVEVTASGWSVVLDPPVKFRRAPGMLALPQPEPGGSIEDLRPFLNVGSEDDWMLSVAWLTAAHRPRGPYPLLALHGEQGCAKTTTARVLRSLVDPNTAATRSESRDERDLVIAASNGWMICLDNLSRLTPWMSDALCRLATGGGFATRELYTDSDEIIFNATRPCMLNGIGELATRGDLLERSIISYLPRIPEEARRDEETFWAEFELARPRILGALLTVISCAMGNLPAVTLQQLPRMADFTRWITAAEPALGWPDGAFLDTYRDHLDRNNELVLESSILVDPLTWIARGGFEGTCAELLAQLSERVEEPDRRRRGWPGSASALSRALRRLAPSLRTAGIEIEIDRTAKGSRVRIHQHAEQPSGETASDPIDGLE